MIVAHIEISKKKSSEKKIWFSKTITIFKHHLDSETTIAIGKEEFTLTI
jgi:hypothetical protein